MGPLSGKHSNYSKTPNFKSIEDKILTFPLILFGTPLTLTFTHFGQELGLLLAKVLGNALMKVLGRNK